MDDCRSDGSVTGEPTTLGAAEHAHEGDVIRGLRSGLVFSLAIWAMLLTVGALVFA
jgi:hypothetical protein